jgi:fibronectin type 3 domain-containing protein
MTRLVTKSFFGAVFILLIAAAGCDRHIESKDPVRSLPGSPPVPVNLAALTNDRTITLTWEVVDTAAVARFRIYRADAEDGDYYRFDSTVQLSRTLSGLPFDRAVWLRATSVSAAGVESGFSEAISARAGLLSIAIANGDDYTNSRTVQIRLNVPSAAAFVELSEDDLFGDAVPRPYQSSLSFELSSGDGTKTVYARITFDNGTVAGEVVADDIILDTHAHIDSVTFSPTGQNFAAGDSIYFFVAASGETGGEAEVDFPGVSSVRLFDNGAGGDATAGDGIYSTLYIVPVGLVVTDGIVTGSFTDAAGNTAVTAQAEDRLNVQTALAPEPVTLAVGLTDTATAHLSWTVNEDGDFASYRIYRSVSPGITVGASQLTVAIITNQGTTSYDDFIPSAGAYYYKIFVFNSQGLNCPGSNEVAVTR